MRREPRDNKLDRLEERLGYSFKDRALLDRALTHSSALKQQTNSEYESYQRMEFLGDRVLGLVISMMLYEAFPKADEGELARRLNQLVRRETCAEVARDLTFGEAIRMGDGEAQTGGRRKNAILGDVCESVIAALYLDGGLEVADRFIRHNWKKRMANASGPLRDAKTTLQEWAQGRGLPAPVYREVSRTGPDHAPTFRIKVEIDGVDPAEASGSSKRVAEHEVASLVLKREGVWSEGDDHV
ncbi:ribonuclease III [Coralliovum pocilloporae]|uniref:ribonuclease III n=1 Tax=Coralliovum pocilloporae TaxID=3066369 RepID=UPI0033072C78